MTGLVQNWWAGFRRWLREPHIIWRQESAARLATIELRQVLPLPVILVVLAWYIGAPSPVVLMSLVTVLGIVIGDFVWALAMVRGVTGRRRLRYTAMQVGDEMEEEILLSNNSSLPVLWAEFVDRSDIPGYTVSSVRGADSNSHVQWRAHTLCTRRGVFSLGPWELRLGQPFGVFLARHVYMQRQEILVYPPMAILPDQVLPHRGLMGDHRPLNQPLRADTIAANSVHAYQPGDPLRRVHWPTSARRAELFVKDFAPEAASNVWLVPDFYSPDHVDEPDGDSSEELMVTVTASLAGALLDARLTVGLFACSQGDKVVLPRQGQTHLWTLLQTLAPLQANTTNPLEDVLVRAGALLTGRDLVVVITPSLRPAWILPLQRLARSRSGSRRAEVIIIEPAAKDGAGEDFMNLLVERGIRTHLLRKTDIQLISGYYGELSRWEFTTTATGRAVARNAPRAAAPEGAADRSSVRFGRGT